MRTHDLARLLGTPHLSALSSAILATAVFAIAFPCAASADSSWKKHTVFEGGHTNTAFAADFTGDGLVDVISNSGGETRLHVAPDWKAISLDPGVDHKFIHSEAWDVDGDGDRDFIATRYQPGLIVWFECPEEPLTQAWKRHVIDDKVIGIHGLLRGDVDGDGHPDLLANSAQPKGDFPESLVWYRTPKNPRDRWERHVFADKDAPGLSHYLGFGDVNGDGRPDAASGAKGGPHAKAGTGDWFAWWEAPKDPTGPWKKHLLSDKEPGATNIHPVDVDGDGDTDFIASRGHGRGVLWFEAPHWKRHEIHPTLKEPHCLVVVDLDGDGDSDAATCAFGDKKAAWFENDGKGGFATHIVGENQEAYDIRAVDMDGDSDLDLLIAGRGSKNVVWYESPLAKSKTHLFVLSGQSNMAGLDPEISFSPTVREALENDEVIIVKDAQGGQPIRRWYKAWKPAKGDTPKATGDLYDRLLVKTRAAIKGKSLSTVTFVWMQGERDAREKHGEVYAASMQGLVDQLEKDLAQENIRVVIGRLSDFDNSNERYPHWTKVRDAQVAFAKTHARYSWVDTDDLNGSKDDLHYTKPGYKQLGERFAKAALKLLGR